MENETLPMFYKILIAVSAGVFGLGIAIAIGHVRLFYIPKLLLVASCILQFILSLGVFIGTILFFKSGLLPDSIPNDDYTMMFVAYALSTIPQLITTTLIFIYDRAVNDWIEKKFAKKDEKGKETHTDNKFTQLDMVSIYKRNKKDSLTPTEKDR